MSNQEWMQRKADATPRGVGVMGNCFAARAKNAEIWDIEGKRYIDFAGGIGALNTGHLHDEVQAAVQKQLTLFSHTCYQVVPYDSYIRLAEKLNQLTPGQYAKKTALFTTGAEAVENAIKIARAATGRSGIIAFSGGFHGRTMIGMALTGKVHPYKAGFGPFPGEIYHAPYPNALHGVSVEDSIHGVEALFKYDIDAKRVAAIIFEPVQGEGGFYNAPAEWVTQLRKLCDEHGILLIADEVQSGFARTGKLLAMHHYKEQADMITMAKSLAGGFPLSALTGRAEVMDAAGPGSLGGTYAGSPLAIAASLAVLDVIEKEKLLDRANHLGNLMKEKLHSLKASVPQIADVRGLGAMIGLEFKQVGSNEPNAAFAKKVQDKALESGLILLTCGVNGNVLRLLFPLTIEDHVFAEGLSKLEAAIKA